MITSLHNERIKQIAKLSDRKERLATGKFLVEGEHLVQEALLAGVCETVLTTSDQVYPVETIQVSDDVIRKCSDTTTPQGVIAVCHKKDARVSGHTRILALDGVSDPGNLGTLIRTAIAFGFTLLVMENTVDPYNPKVLRATQGGIFKIDFLSTNLPSFLEKQAGVSLAAVVSDAVDFQTIKNPQTPLTLVLGSESLGIREETLEHCTHRVTIPMENTESLNVAIAGAIMMHHFQLKKG